MAGEVTNNTNTSGTSTTTTEDYAESYNNATDAAADNTGTATDTGEADPTTTYAGGTDGGDTGAQSSNTNSTNTSTSANGTNGSEEGDEHSYSHEASHGSTASETVSSTTSEVDAYQKALELASTTYGDDSWMIERMAAFQEHIDAAQTAKQLQQVWQQRVLPVVNAVVPPPAEQMAQKQDEKAAQQADQMSQADLALFANMDTAQTLLKSVKGRLSTLMQTAKKAGLASYKEFVSLLPQVNARTSDVARARELSRLRGDQGFQTQEFAQEKLGDFNQLIFKAQKMAGKAAHDVALTAKEKFALLKENFGKAVAGDGMLFDKDQKAVAENHKKELQTLAKDAETEDAGKSVKEMNLDAEMREHEAAKLNTQQTAEIDEAQDEVADLNNGAVPEPTTDDKTKAIALLEAAGRLTFEQAKELKEKAEKAAGTMVSGALVAASESLEEAQSAVIGGLLSNAAPALNGNLSPEEKGKARYDLTSAHKAITEGKAYKLATSAATTAKAQAQQAVTTVKTQAQTAASQVSQGVAQVATYTKETANELLTKTKDELTEKMDFMKTKVGSWENSLDDAFGYYTQWTRSKVDNGENRVAAVVVSDPNRRQ